MLELLADALSPDGREDLRGAAALRLRVRLQPAAGEGARVMPPTYSTRSDRPGASGPVYLTEERRLEGEKVPCVVIDGHASQANRLEESLLARIETDRIAVPDIVVDQAEFGRNSALSFPHRIFDAWCEDALDGDRRFGETDEYARLAGVIHRGVAGPLVRRFPVGLLLGCWASRRSNPQGATRIARAITGEIIGFDYLDGERASSRVDLHHVSSAVPLRPTTDSHAARFATEDVAKGAKGTKRPSEFGYGNVTPQAAAHGGVTVRYAEQQTVLSLAALRAVRTGVLGGQAPTTAESDRVARELLALLGLAMLESRAEEGWELRSGCHLVPESEPTIELVGRIGNVLASASLVGLGSIDALASASQGAKEHNIDWEAAPIELCASPEQLSLLRQSLGRPVEESPQG